MTAPSAADMVALIAQAIDTAVANGLQSTTIAGFSGVSYSLDQLREMHRYWTVIAAAAASPTGSLQTTKFTNQATSPC